MPRPCAFDEFAARGLPERVHATMIASHLGEQIVGHLNRDSTEIVARERPADKPAPALKPARRRGRPKQGESRPKEPTRIEQQLRMNELSQIIADLPRACDVGTKRDSQGHKHSWLGRLQAALGRGRRGHSDRRTAHLGLVARQPGVHPLGEDECRAGHQPLRRSQRCCSVCLP
jgi:hypothetical protein